MPRRQLFPDEQWGSLLAPPRKEREIVRHCTLSRDDLDLIAAKRSDHSRLGFAILLCYLRHPGRALEAGETPPAVVARRLAAAPAGPAKDLMRNGAKSARAPAPASVMPPTAPGVRPVQRTSRSRTKSRQLEIEPAGRFVTTKPARSRCSTSLSFGVGSQRRSAR